MIGSMDGQDLGRIIIRMSIARISCNKAKAKIIFALLSSGGKIAVLPLALVVTKRQHNSLIFATDGDVLQNFADASLVRITGDFCAVAIY